MFFIFIVGPKYALAQSKDMVIAFGKLKIEWGNLDYTKITLLEDGKYLDKQNPPNNGKFEFGLELNHNYVFVFEKPNYVTKKVEFNTHVPEEVTSDPEFEPFPDFDFYVTLFQTYPEVDTMFFVNAVGKIMYNPSLKDFDWDKDYTLKIEKSLQEIEDKIKQKHNEEEKQANQKSKTPKEEPQVNSTSVEPEKTNPPAEEVETVNTKPAKQPDIAEEINQKSSPPPVVQTVLKDEKAAPVQEEKQITKETKKQIINNEVKQNHITYTNPQTLPKPVNTKPKVYSAIIIDKKTDVREYAGKSVTTVTITRGDIVTIYKKVNYSWGGQYYFIQDETNAYRNISESYFNSMTTK